MADEEKVEFGILVSRIEFRRAQYQKQIDETLQSIQNEVKFIQESEQRLTGLRQRLTATQGAAAGLDEIISAPETYGVEVDEDVDKPMEV